MISNLNLIYWKKGETIWHSNNNNNHNNNNKNIRNVITDGAVSGITEVDFEQLQVTF